MADGNDLKQFFAKMKEEVKVQTSKVLAGLESLHAQSGIVGGLTPLIMKDTHQRILLSLEKLNGLEGRWTTQLQEPNEMEVLKKRELSGAEAARQECTSQLQKLTAATIAVETAGRKAKEDAEALVAAQVDALRGDAQLAKTRAILAQTRASLAQAEAGKNAAEVVTLREQLLTADERADMRVADRVAELERRLQEAESRVDARASRNASQFQGTAVAADDVNRFNDLQRRTERLELLWGQKRGSEEVEDLERSASKAVVIDGSAARARVGRGSSPGEVVKSKQENPVD